MTPQEFDKLLSWLAPDREVAGKKYVEIRQQLIRFYTCWGCSEPEDLADHTIDRVVPWMEQKSWATSEAPIRVFYAFARNIRHEDRRRPQVEPISPDMPKPPATEDKEEDFACLEACIASLSATEADLIRHYYQYDQPEKIRKRQALAQKLGIGMNALRIQAWKIRSRLRGCLTKCIQSKHSN